MTEAWDKSWLDAAEDCAEQSEDPSTQTGCVIVRGNNVLGAGFNRFPRGVAYTPWRLNHRPAKYKFMLHAEIVALTYAVGDLRGATAYVHPWQPCATCTGMLIERGISEIVTRRPTEAQIDRWGDEWDIACMMAHDVGLSLRFVD